jgi:transposase
VRLPREFKERGSARGYSVVRDRGRELRPSQPAALEVHFEMPAGKRAQVEFAKLEVAFTDEPRVDGIVWLFSVVLCYSRLIWARFMEIACCGDRLFARIRGALEWKPICLSSCR